jgi:hypothetical protein
MADGVSSDSSGDPVRDYDAELGPSRSGLHHYIPPQSVGFWHHHMSKVRAHVLLLWARTGIVTPLSRDMHALSNKTKVG